MFPLDWDAPEEKALVPPGQTVPIPQPDDIFDFNVGPEVGTFEVLILASIAPLRNALKGLQTIARGRGATRGSPLEIREDEPINVVGDLLGDIDTLARSRSGGAAPVLIRKQAVDTSPSCPWRRRGQVGDSCLRTLRATRIGAE